MKLYKVFIPEVICKESHKVLEEIAEVIEGRGYYTESELIEQVKDVDAVLTTSRNKFTRRVLENAEKLKLIIKYGAKPDNVDIEAATELGIIVEWTPGVEEDSVAEHAVTLILALCKRLFFMMNHLKKGRWRTIDTTLTHELMGKTVGIIGLGGIGRKVAEKLMGFKVRLIYYDPYVPEEKGRELGAMKVDLNTLLQESDIITIHARLTKETRGLIGEEELKKMKNTAFLVNTARGAIIDEKALYRALKEGWIAGAALDVFEREPPQPDNPLLKLDNVILTPHIAAWTYESLRRQAFMAAEETVRVLKGGEPRYILNPDSLKRRR
ncbi:hydroxyacid dehydrogenase [Candidatus Bathyarchaeota archaeon]|nr:hydroxyacid dehydrogenase [Candidatus Bathyarchaeota archaeon]